jgi:hypothetical protein
MKRAKRWLLAMAVSLSCRASPPPEEPTPSRALPRLPAPPASAAAVGGEDGGHASPWPEQSIAETLRAEAQDPARPVLPRADGFLAALERSGVRLRGKSQALASPFGALYCMSADTGSGVGLLVCEYGAEVDAKVPEAIAVSWGRALPFEFHRRQGLLLGVMAPAEGAQSEAKRVAALFRSF